MAEIRQDMVTGRRVIVATYRGRRPDSFISVAGESDHKQHEKVPAYVNDCPFCEGNESMTPPEKVAWRDDGPENSPGWKLRVVPNKFPAAEITDRPAAPLQEWGEQAVPAYGEHEVIIETPLHNRHPGAIPHEQMHLILACYRQRCMSLAENSSLRSVTIYRNHKKGGGVSVEHPHSQLIALPFIPSNITEELEGSRRYFQEKKRCAFCVMTDEEYHNGEHIIFENQHFISIAPYSSRLPFETWIMPKKHYSSFIDMSPDDLKPLAEIMNEVLGRLSFLLNDPPYNYYLHTAPFFTDSLPYYHWHLEIIPRLTTVAGFEMGSGVYINETVPEDSARYLKEIKGYVYA